MGLRISRTIPMTVVSTRSMGKTTAGIVVYEVEPVGAGFVAGDDGRGFYDPTGSSAFTPSAFGIDTNGRAWLLPQS